MPLPAPIGRLFSPSVDSIGLLGAAVVGLLRFRLLVVALRFASCAIPGRTALRPFSACSSSASLRSVPCLLLSCVLPPSLADYAS